jgi:hypothetical protein
MAYAHLPTTEAAVTAIREVAREFGLSLSVTDDIGADRTSRRSAAALFTVRDPDGSLPHEAFVDLAGVPSVSVRLFPEDDAKITVEGVEFHDVPRDAVPPFLRSVYGGLAFTKGRLFPPGHWLVVPLPGDETYKELIPALAPTPWLSGRIRRWRATGRAGHGASARAERAGPRPVQAVAVKPWRAARRLREAMPGMPSAAAPV